MLYYPYHGKILTILPTWVCLRDPCATPNQFAPQTLSQSLATQGFGRAGSLFTFPRKGTETPCSTHHLYRETISLFTFPRKGTETFVNHSLRPPDMLIIIYISPQGDGNWIASRRLSSTCSRLLLTFPRKGTETNDGLSDCCESHDHYLHFPVRGRKLYWKISISHLEA